MSVITLEGVGKRYRQTEGSDMLLKRILTFYKRPHKREVWAMRDVDVSIGRGETVGVIGRNGSGKTTMLRLLAGVSAPTTGRVRVEGVVAPLIGVGVGFNPELTGRENVFANGQILGMSPARIRSLFDEIVAFSEIESFLDVPVKFYSSGMFLRLAFSVAIHVEPDILLVDEVLAVGDVAFQLKCFERMQELRASGTTIVVVTHNMTSLSTLCNRAVLLSHGRVVFDGHVDDGIAAYHRLMHEEARSHRSVGAEELTTRGIEDSDDNQPDFSGGCEVTLEILNAGGEAVTHVRAGTPLEVRIHAEFESEVVNPVFGYLLGSGYFGNIYMLNTLPGDYVGVHGPGRPLDAILTLQTPLLENDFKVAFVVLDPIGGSVLGHTMWEQFYVTSQSQAKGLIDVEGSLRIGEQVLEPGTRFRLSTNESASSA